MPRGMESYRGLRDPALAALKSRELYGFFRARMFERDEGTCGICGSAVSASRFDLDHIVQLAEGGPDHWDNIRVTHPRCNRARPRIQKRSIRKQDRTGMNLPLPPDMLSELKTHAAAEDRSVTNLVLRILREWLLDEAARAYDAAALKLYGEFARPNFAPEIEQAERLR